MLDLVQYWTYNKASTMKTQAILEPVIYPLHKNFRDISGMRCGRLTVESVAGRKGALYYWNCKCDCGGTAIVPRSCLNGGTQSCGCLHREATQKFLGKHFMTNSITYKSWLNMRRRCNDPKNNRYERYGGRGIKVCDRWNESFQSFLQDVGERPSLDHSIERRDNNRGYEPNNCYWASRQEQSNNKKTSVLWQFNDRKQTIGEWSKETGIGWDTLKSRVSIYGWSIERALTTPTPRTKKCIELETP